MLSEETKIRRICIPQNTMIKGIPLAFDESLSWLEQICAILHKLNETITQVNSNTEWINNYEDQYEKLQKEIDDINLIISNIESDITNLENTKASKTELQNAINELNSSLRELIGSEYNTLKEYVDNRDANLQYQIDHFDVGNITLLDPTTGVYSSIQVVIDNIYDQTRDEAITAYEYDTLDLTATVYDSYDLTAFNYDRYGKTLLTE